jgi:hypothetical protein
MSTSKKPTQLELLDVRVFQEMQTISFTLKTDTLMIPLTLVKRTDKQWWLSISSADYPNTRTNDYSCEDLPTSG